MLVYSTTEGKLALILESGAKDKQSLGRLAYHLNRLARKKKHPNLFEVIELIKQEQAATKVQIIQLAGSGEPRPEVQDAEMRRQDKETNQ